jgi:hypothetical protein
MIHKYAVKAWDSSKYLLLLIVVILVPLAHFGLLSPVTTGGWCVGTFKNALLRIPFVHSYYWSVIIGLMVYAFNFYRHMFLDTSFTLFPKSMLVSGVGIFLIVFYTMYQSSVTAGESFDTVATLEQIRFGKYLLVPTILIPSIYINWYIYGNEKNSFFHFLLQLFSVMLFASVFSEFCVQVYYNSIHVLESLLGGMGIAFVYTVGVSVAASIVPFFFTFIYVLFRSQKQNIE